MWDSEPSNPRTILVLTTDIIKSKYMKILIFLPLLLLGVSHFYHSAIGKKDRDVDIEINVVDPFW